MGTAQGQRRIVVGVDGSEQALGAVRWAAAEARRRGVAVRLVTAFELSDGVGTMGPKYSEVMHEYATTALEDAAVAVRQLAPDVEIDRGIVVGFPTGVLTAESRHADLLVVGESGTGRLTALVAGSVAVGVTSSAACPVVVVRGAEHAGSGSAPIVVGVDGTPAGEAAIAFGFEAASTRRAPLVAIQTWGDPRGDMRAAAFWADIADDAERSLAERLAGWGEKYPDVAVRRVVSHDRPTQRLLELSKEAQLVVVGSRGHGELTGLVLGSVSNALVHRAECPVAVVRPPQA